MEGTKHTIFQIGDGIYGLDVSDVRTVETYTESKKTGQMPANIKGVIKAGEEIIPVYSLRKKFNLQDKEPDVETRLIITRTNNMWLAYEVDKILEVVDIGYERRFETPAIFNTKETSYIKRIIDYKEQLVIIMEHNKILSEQEQAEIMYMIKNVL